MLKLAILDDYGHVALELADWSRLAGVADITVFDRHLSEEEAASALKPFDVLCTMRERTALPRSLFERLPNLKLVAIVGLSLPNLDMAAATERGVLVIQSDFRTAEFERLRELDPGARLGPVDRHRCAISPRRIGACARAAGRARSA